MLCFSKQKLLRSAACVAVSFVSALLGTSCGSYEGVDSENGRLAIIQQANQFLNSAMCDQAINLLMPLYQSAYVDSEVRMTLSSAYACKAGFSFPTVVAALKDSSSSDIFTLLVKAMYSSGDDEHLRNYRQAITHILETATGGSDQASARTSDANVYMILMQTGALSSVLSVLGQANRATGAKTQVVDSVGSTAIQRCTAQNALAVINNSLLALGSTGSLGTLNSTITSICNSTGGCTNLDYTACMNDAVVLQPFGVAILAAIDLIWQL